MRPYLLVAVLSLCLYAAPSHAVDPHAAHHAHKSTAKQKPAKAKKHSASKSVKAYIAAMNAMHKSMDITYTGNADIDFARGMVPHHQGAIDMIAVLQEHGKDPELREKANFMSRWQKAEVTQMQTWITGHYNPKLARSDNEVAKAYQTIMHSMHKNMDIEYTGNADVDFVNGMIPHHQGAIDMAWVLVEHGRDPLLRKIAGDVIRSQQQEIAWMRDWLKRNAQ